MSSFEMIISIIRFLFVIGAFAIILYFIFSWRKKANKDFNTILDRIKENDEYFDLEDLKKIVKENLVEISKCILHCDSSGLMNIESKSLYDIDSIKIKNAISNDFLEENVIESVEKVSLVDCKIKDGFEHVYFRAFISQRNISIIPSKNEITKMESYPVSTFKLIDVMRSVNVKTDPNVKANIHRCPNCGAEIEINNLGKCIYCGSYIINGNTSWVINRIDDYYIAGGNEM